MAWGGLGAAVTIGALCGGLRHALLGGLCHPLHRLLPRGGCLGGELLDGLFPARRFGAGCRCGGAWAPPNGPAIAI